MFSKVKTSSPILGHLLQGAALIQIAVVILSVSLAHALGASGAFRRWPVEVRELFLTYLVFNSLAALASSILTLRFSGDIAERTHPLCRWLSGAVAVYWLLRAWAQFTYCLSGQPPVSYLHALFFVVYAGVTGIYAVATLRPDPGT